MPRAGQYLKDYWLKEFTQHSCLKRMTLSNVFLRNQKTTLISTSFYAKTWVLLWKTLNKYIWLWSESEMSSIGTGLKPFHFTFYLCVWRAEDNCQCQCSAMWVPRTEFWSSHLAASTFTHQASLLAPHVLFLLLIGWWCYFEKLWDP